MKSRVRKELLRFAPDPSRAEKGRSGVSSHDRFPCAWAIRRLSPSVGGGQHLVHEGGSSGIFGPEGVHKGLRRLFGRIPLRIHPEEHASLTPVHPRDKHAR